MNRGDVFLVEAPRADPRRQRAFVVVSREAALAVAHSTVICAPIYTNGHDLQTEVRLGVAEGLKHESYVRCDDLRSIEKSRLTNFIGRLSAERMAALDLALAVALGIDHLLV